MKSRLFVLLAALLALFAQPAAAQLDVCNKTPGPLSISIAYETEADVVSQGWWTVDPDKCETVITAPLDKQYYYHYAVSRALNVEWAGTFNFCTNDDPQFRISGASDCEQRNFRTQGFRQTDVGHNKRFTLDISMGPVPAAATSNATPPAETQAAQAPAAETPAVETPAAETPATDKPAETAPAVTPEATAPVVTTEPTPAAPAETPAETPAAPAQ